jgi:hypothetical protein
MLRTVLLSHFIFCSVTAVELVHHSSDSEIAPVSFAAPKEYIVNTNSGQNEHPTPESSEQKEPPPDSKSSKNQKPSAKGSKQGLPPKPSVSIDFVFVLLSST